jgi:DEAD/DEAH box helicase domain-containing protein
MCDGRDLGAVIGDRSRDWFLNPVIPGRPSRPGEQPAPPPPDVFEPTIFLYDHYSGGIGLAEALQPRFAELLAGARGRLASCPCAHGCPSCVGPEKEVGRSAKATGLRLLDLLISRLDARSTDLEEPIELVPAPPAAFQP